MTSPKIPKTLRIVLMAMVAFLCGWLLPMEAKAVPQQSDYCYLPPFVTDPTTPPNITLVYEKTADIKKRAYSTTYNPGQTYYGFFDAHANYKYDASNNYFYKPSTICTPSGADLGCISGNVLNWALMSNLDVSRKALVGFGWPDPGSGTGAGDVFTYSGNFCSAWSGNTCTNANREPVSYGQWEDGKDLAVSATLEMAGINYSYAFCLAKTTGSNPTGMRVRVKSNSTSAPACAGGCSGSCSTVVDSGQVGTKLHKVCSNNSARVCTASADCVSPGTCQEEERAGIVQKYGDKDKNYRYDTDSLRLSIRRWNSGNDKQEDIEKNTGLTDTERQSYFKTILTSVSKAPPDDPQVPLLGAMENDLINYFSESSASYIDNDSWTQTPYNWKNSDTDSDAAADPATACRKTFTIFITTGKELLNASDVTHASLPAACNPIPAFNYSKTCASDLDCISGTCSGGICSPTSYTCSHAFEKNACYAFNTDFIPGATGRQNIRTYVVHTAFYGGAASMEPYLACAAKAGSGDYFRVEDPTSLRSKIEEALLNIMSTSASASTVATLTTQTRESSTLTQAYFYPKKEGTPLRWTGYLRLFWSDAGANLREDTANTGWLDLKKDNILAFYYSGDGCDGGPCYKVKTYADSNADLKADSCGTIVEDKDNASSVAIWNAQTKLQSRTTDDRTIKIGIGDASGVAASSQMFDFTTDRKATLRPFWSYSNYCSNNVSLLCDSNSDCYSCLANPEKNCSASSDCNYCNAHAGRTCLSNADCNYCNVNTSRVCAASSDCNYCQDTFYPSTDPVNQVLGNRSCTAGSAPVPGCRYCSNNPNIVCTSDAECPGGFCYNDYHINCITGNYTDPGSLYSFAGDTCTTTDTCNTSDSCNTSATCRLDCDTNCAESVIKYVRGYDRPTNAGGSYPGSIFRIRQTADAGTTDNLATLKLGDIVYSTPRISPNSAVNGYDITYKDGSYAGFTQSTIIKEATPIVVVGANDGMVHAFKVGKIKDISPAVTDAGGVTDGYAITRFSDDPPTADTAPPTDIGKELWAYIPYNAMPYLRWYCDANYCHIPMVDARFTVVDASVDYDRNGVVSATEGGSATDPRCPGASPCPPYPWRRLLVGAMGVGGQRITTGGSTLSSSVFVLDITDPLVPRLLWEKPLPDGTLTTGAPAVVRLSSKPAGGSPAADDENGEWYVVMGSGPVSVLTNQVTYKTSGNANIYAFNLRTGALAGTIDIGASGVAVGDLMPVDIDSDYQTDVIYFGTYGGSGATQTGKLYRLRMREGTSYQTPANWDISTVVDTGRPIYASPEIAQDASGNIWLYFGTGLYLSLDHAKTTTDYEYLYGLKESTDCWKGTGTCSTYSNFLDTSGITFTGAKALELGCFCTGTLVNTYKCTPAGSCPSSPCGTAEDTVVLKVEGATISGTGIPSACVGQQDKNAIACLETEMNSRNGWKYALQGKKMFSRPFIAGGLVDFTAFEPKSTPCSLGGDTHLVSLHYTTGTAYVQPTILLGQGTAYASLSNITLKASVNLGTGIPPLGESLVALPLAGDTYKVITQVSGGLSGTGFVPSLPARPGYVLWQVR